MDHLPAAVQPIHIQGQPTPYTGQPGDAYAYMDEYTAACIAFQNNAPTPFFIYCPKNIQAKTLFHFINLEISNFPI